MKNFDNIKNLFGTDGIRNKVGKYPFTLQDLPKLGQALAIWAIEKYGSQANILIISDTRISCPWVKSSLKSGLLIFPVNIYDAGILPTPAVFYLMRKLKKFHASIVISASHNSFQDNGIKIIDSKTGKLNYIDELAISSLLDSQVNFPDNYSNFGSLKVLESAHEIYIQEILSNFSSNFLENKKIVLDTANGATYQIAPDIFNKFGAQVITINNHPDGININKNCGALNLDSLVNAVLENQADIGFAFDGDGDRVIAVNSLGEIKNGDDLLAILSTASEYSSINRLVGTLMSNQGLEVYLKKKNKDLIRTQIGDKFILEELANNNLILGGEQSGHIILRNLINTGDGILVALKIVETLNYTNNWLMETFYKYPQVLLNIPVNSKQDLNQYPFNQLISESKNRLNQGRLVVRYSGTEPVLRIMIEEESETLANSIAQELACVMQQKLS